MLALPSTARSPQQNSSCRIVELRITSPGQNSGAVLAGRHARRRVGEPRQVQVGRIVVVPAQQLRQLLCLIRIVAARGVEPVHLLSLASRERRHQLAMPGASKQCGAVARSFKVTQTHANAAVISHAVYFSSAPMSHAYRRCGMPHRLDMFDILPMILSKCRSEFGRKSSKVIKLNQASKRLKGSRLETDDVDVLLLHNARCAWQVQLVVLADAVEDVVRHHAQPVAPALFRRISAGVWCVLLRFTAVSPCSLRMS